MAVPSKLKYLQSEQQQKGVFISPESKDYVFSFSSVRLQIPLNGGTIALKYNI